PLPRWNRIRFFAGRRMRPAKWHRLGQQDHLRPLPRCPPNQLPRVFKVALLLAALDPHLDHGQRKVHLRSERIPIQHTAPAKQTTPPSAMPTGQPNRSLTHGVMTGASIPPPFPPVFMIAAAVPPKRPPASTIVDQNAPSAAPT